MVHGMVREFVISASCHSFPFGPVILESRSPLTVCWVSTGIDHERATESVFIQYGDGFTQMSGMRIVESNAEGCLPTAVPFANRGTQTRLGVGCVAFFLRLKLWPVAHRIDGMHDKGASLWWHCDQQLMPLDAAAPHRHGVPF